MFHAGLKVYYDGSSYVAILPDQVKRKERQFVHEDKIEVIEEVKDSVNTDMGMSNNVKRMLTKKEYFDELYKANIGLKKAAMKEVITTQMKKYFMSEALAEAYVEANIRRKKHNLGARMVRLRRKVNLHDFNYFCTVTYFYGHYLFMPKSGPYMPKIRSCIDNFIKVCYNIDNIDEKKRRVSMIKIAIVEDEEKYRKPLQRFIFDYGKEKKIEFNVHSFSSGLDFLSAIEKATFDLVFMDIILDEYDGLEVSRRLREKDERVIIIFVTNMAQYAIKGYEVDALDFLVKPISYVNFTIKMGKALKALNFKQQETKIPLKTSEGLIFILPSQVCYVECFAHYLEYYILSENKKRVKKYTVRGSITEAEKALSNVRIERCHKSFLVNLSHITGVDKNTVFVKSDGEPRGVPLSKMRRNDFMKKLLEFYSLEGR